MSSRSSRHTQQHTGHTQEDVGWILDENTGAYYREYIDEEGQVQHEWYDDSTPRTGIEAGFESLSVNDALENNPDQDYILYQPGGAATQFQEGHIQQEHRYRGGDELDRDAFSQGTYNPGGYGPGGHQSYEQSLPNEAYDDVAHPQGNRSHPTRGDSGPSSYPEARHSETHGGEKPPTRVSKDKGKGKAEEKRKTSRHPETHHSSKAKHNEAPRPGKGKDKSTGNTESAKKKGKSRDAGEPREPFYETSGSRNAPSSSRPRTNQTGAARGPIDGNAVTFDENAGIASAQTANYNANAYGGGSAEPYPASSDSQYGPGFQAAMNQSRSPDYDNSVEHGDDDPALRAAMDQSRTLYYTEARAQAHYDPRYETGESSARGAYEQSAYVDGEENAYEYGYESLQTVRADVPAPQIGDHEPADARYKVEPSNRFQPGTVLKVFWAEPLGSSAQSRQTEYTEKAKKNLDEPYTGIRRFIVVGNDEGHCACVPIYTYLNQGCKKKGVKADRHGIVYDAKSKSKPRALHGEPELGFRPVRMHIDAPGEALAKESRVNYATLATIQHNYKVYIIGRINNDDYLNTVLYAVDKCWERKTRAKPRR